MVFVIKLYNVCISFKKKKLIFLHFPKNEKSDCYIFSVEAKAVNEQIRFEYLLIEFVSSVFPSESGKLGYLVNLFCVV